MKEPPYLIKLALQAFTDAPRRWQETLRIVRQRDIKSLPQTSVSLLQPALAKVLDRNMSYKSKTSDELFEEIAKRTDEYFGASLLKSKEDTMKMLLRLGCVLLRMQKLDKDPTISRAIYDTGCIKTNLFTKDIFQLSQNDINSIKRKLKNANKTKSGALLDDRIIDQIAMIFKQIPTSKVQIVHDLAKTLFSSITDIYDQEYLKWASTKSNKIPTEFLLLLAEKNSTFESTAFVSVTKKIYPNQSLKSIEVAQLQPLLMKKSFENTNNTFDKVQTLKEYSKIIHHAQSVISFYQKIKNPSSEDSRLISSLKKMFEALKVFQDKAPKNMDVIFSGTFEISSLLQTNPLGKSNVAERLLYSQMYNKFKIKKSSNKTLTNKTLNQPVNKSLNKTPNNPLKPTNKPTNKPTTNKPTTNKPTSKPANADKSKTPQKNRKSPNTVIAPLLG